MIPYSPLAGLVVTLGFAAIVSAILIWINPSSQRHLPENWESYDLEQIREKYSDLAGPGSGLELLLAFALILPLSFGLYLLQRYIVASKAAGAVYVFSNSWGAYILPVMFLSFILGGFLAQFLFTWRVRSRGTPEEFAIWRYDWERNKTVDYRGMQGTVAPIVEHPHRMATFITILIFVVFFANFVLLDTYTTVADDKVVVNSLTDLREHEYTYDKVDRILYLDRIKIASGEIIYQEPLYAIIFSDGWIAYTRYWGMDIRFQTIIDAVNYISTKSGVPIERGISNVDVHHEPL